MFLKHDPRRAATTSIALAATLALAACTGGGGTSTANSSQPSTGSTTSGPSSASSTTDPTSVATESGSSSATPSTSSSATATSSTTAASSTSTATTGATSTTSSTSATSTPAAPTTKKAGASQALINSCVNANSRSNSAVTIWNNAVRSQKAADLDSAANNFRSTATYLRTLTKEPGDKQFTPLVWKVAKDFDDMADARKARRTVSTSTYNTDAQKLRQYCTTKISA